MKISTFKLFIVFALLACFVNCQDTNNTNTTNATNSTTPTNNTQPVNNNTQPVVVTERELKCSVVKTTFAAVFLKEFLYLG